MAPESCLGCDGTAPEHPYVGVTFVGDVPVAYPVCAACHQTPPRPLDVHFFPREMREVALARAGSTNLG